MLESKVNRQIDLFKSNLPKKPYCTSDLASGLIIRSAATAIKHRYIQPNHPNSKLWLMYDIDYPIGIETISDDLNLPTPTFFVQNKDNCHAHLLYALNTAVHLNENSSKRAMRFAGAVDTAMTVELKADAGYVGLITKNPLHEHWRAYNFNAQYDLNDFTDYVDLAKFSDKRKLMAAGLESAVGLGRNCDLFDTLRRWAYQAIKTYYGGSSAAWYTAVEAKADKINCDFTALLPFSEIKSTAKSVARYVWLHHDPALIKNNHRGRDLLKNLELDLHDKQVLSAVITNRQRSENTQQAITHAVVRLQAGNKKVTQKAVSDLSGLSERAVRNHWNLVK